MLDLNVELGDLLDELQRADVEFALTGSLARTLHRGDGVQRSIDVVVWPDDRSAAETLVRRHGFVPMGPPKPAHVGRYRLQRLMKTDATDILALNLAAPASFVTATWLGVCVKLPWQGRAVKVTGRATIDAIEPALPWTARSNALDALQFSWLDRETWAERDLLPRFDALMGAPESATAADVETLLVGLQSDHCPLRWTWREVAHLLDTIPQELLERHDALAAYRRAAQAASGAGRYVRRYFRTTAAGLEWA